MILNNRLLAEASEGDDKLTTEEILSNATLLLVAGHETTTSLLSNGIYPLMQNPDQFDLVKSDDSLIPNLVEEVLRYDAPVQSVGRTAFEDITIETEDQSYTFPKGDHVTVILGAVGRNPSANSAPENFEVTRQEINHLAFSKGIHYCLGAGLARLEAKLAFSSLIEEMPNLKLNGLPKRNPNWLLRGFSTLPLTI
jgi:cytochrome P450